MPDALISTQNLDFTPRTEVFPSPRDWRDQFIYQLLIDRFDDAQDHPPFDPANGDGATQSHALAPDDAVWPIELQNPEVYNRRGRIRDFSGCCMDEALNGDFCDLKDFDLRQPQAIDTLIRCYKYWIAVTDVDGYRLDTVKHSDPEATAIFCNAIREYARSIGKDNFILFGEVVADDELLGKYIGSNTPADAAERYPRLNACLDFPLYFVLEEVIKGQTSPQALRDRYEKFRHFYRDFGEVGRYFITFVDNHDQMARPYRRFMHGVDDPNLAVLAIGYLLTNMGIPCIYYGTEQGFNGAGADDLAVRENMFGGAWGAFDTRDVHFFNPDHPIYKGIAAIANLRANEPALRYGREYFRDISGNGADFGPPTTGQCTLAYSRVLDTTEILIALNLDTSPRTDCITVDPNLTPPGSTVTDLLNGGVHTVESGPNDLAFLRLPLQPRCMAILKKTES